MLVLEGTGGVEGVGAGGGLTVGGLVAGGEVGDVAEVVPPWHAINTASTRALEKQRTVNGGVVMWSPLEPRKTAGTECALLMTPAL
jgi:hypothetical protein